MELFSRPAVALRPTRRFPQFGSFLPVSPWIQIISMLLKNFQTLPAKTLRLKYLAILPLSLCFVTVYSKFFFKRSFLPDIEHNRGYAIITYFQTTRRQGNNNLILAVLLSIKKLNDLIQSRVTISMVKS